MYMRFSFRTQLYQAVDGITHFAKFFPGWHIDGWRVAQRTTRVAHFVSRSMLREPPWKPRDSTPLSRSTKPLAYAQTYPFDWSTVRRRMSFILESNREPTSLFALNRSR